MTPRDLLRSARDLESAGDLAGADHLRWLAAGGGVVSSTPEATLAVPGGSTYSEPAADWEDAAERSAPCLLSAALREAEACGDLALAGRLAGALAGVGRGGGVGGVPARCRAG